MPINDHSRSYPQLKEFGVFRDLVNSTTLNRLSDISFLGAIDRLGTNPDLMAGTRLEHSIGVAYLAYLGSMHLGKDEQNLAIATALLHDAGHGPLSHSTEPFFRRKFNIDHRTEGRRLLRENNEIVSILQNYKIDIKRIDALAFGKQKDDPLSFLFHYPINIDTIEGIIRSARSFQWDGVAPQINRLIQLLVAPDEDATEAGDTFWNLKWVIYNWYILWPQPAIYDAISQVALIEPEVSKSDFLLTDSLFLKKFGSSIKRIFDVLATEAESKNFSISNVVGKNRQFVVDENIRIREPRDLSRRYKEGKNASRTIPSD